MYGLVLYSSLYGIYLKGSGGGALGLFQFMVEKHVCIVYNMLNKEADTIADTYPFPAKYWSKNSTLTLQERRCYFLWLTYSKIATMSIAVVSITMNSSYVLIENASFRSRLGTEVYTPYQLPGEVYYIVMVLLDGSSSAQMIGCTGATGYSSF